MGCAVFLGGVGIVVIGEQLAVPARQEGQRRCPLRGRPAACESGTPVVSQRLVYRFRSIVICVIAVHIHIERIALACIMTAASCLSG